MFDYIMFFSQSLFFNIHGNRPVTLFCINRANGSLQTAEALLRIIRHGYGIPDGLVIHDARHGTGSVLLQLHFITDLY